jgi:hypothetical protein
VETKSEEGTGVVESAKAAAVVDGGVEGSTGADAPGSGEDVAAPRGRKRDVVKNLFRRDK